MFSRGAAVRVYFLRVPVMPGIPMSPGLNRQGRLPVLWSHLHGIKGTRKKHTCTAAPLENIAHAGTPVSSTGGW